MFRQRVSSWRGQRDGQTADDGGGGSPTGGVALDGVPSGKATSDRFGLGRHAVSEGNCVLRRGVHQSARGGGMTDDAPTKTGGALKQRRNGEGQIRQRRDGRWEGRVWVFTSDGGEVRRSVYGATW